MVYKKTNELENNRMNKGYLSCELASADIFEGKSVGQQEVLG